MLPGRRGVRRAARARSGLRHGRGPRGGGVHGPPPLLGGLDELEDHGQGGGAGAGTAGDLGPQPHGGERGLDGVRGPQTDPPPPRRGRGPLRLRRCEGPRKPWAYSGATRRGPTASRSSGASR